MRLTQIHRWREADLFSLGFNADGAAVNTLTGKALAVTGNPTVTMDAALAQYVGVFNGSSAYRFGDMPSLYPLMEQGFTFEAYVYVESKPNSGYVDFVSNQQGGGFGFEYKSDGKIYYYLHDGSGYKQPAQAMPTGQWVHLVGVFDGSEVTLYVNGKGVSVSASGSTMKFPSDAARYLCIGGDSNDGTGDSFMTGKIATTNLYSFALSAEMVETLYRKAIS